MQANVAAAVLKARDGDRAAFRALVDRYQSAVSAAALAIVRDVSYSHDIAQDAFVEAWRKLPALRQPESFGPWLLQMTRQRALQGLRGEQRMRLRELRWQAEQPAIAQDAESLAQAGEPFAELYAALEALPDDARELLILYYREGLSTHQICALLELSEPAVRKRLERARAALRDKVERFGALAIASGPPRHFSARVQREVLAKPQANWLRAPWKLAIVSAAAVALLATAIGFELLPWQSRGDVLQANDLAADAVTARGPAPANSRAPAPGRAGAPASAALIADSPTPPDAGATAPDDAPPTAATLNSPVGPALLTPVPAPIHAVSLDAAKLARICQVCSPSAATNSALRNSLLTRAQGDGVLSPDDVERARSLLRALHDIEPRKDYAIRAVMRAHSVHLVLDTRATLDPGVDITEEVAKLIEQPGSLPFPLANTEAPPPRPALLRKGFTVIESPLPSPVPIEKIGVIDIPRAVLDNADGSKFSSLDHAMAALPALATRIVQLERDAAAKEHLELVLDRRVVVDSDSEIRDLTRDTIEAYDDAFAPVALRLPHLQSAAVDWEHRSQAEVARTLSNLAGRDVDLRNCTRDIFFQHAESPLPELFSAFAREHNLYWIDFGADLAARCPRPAVPSQPIPYSSHLNPSEIFSVSLSLLQGDCDGYQVFGLAPHGEWTKRGVQNRDVLHEVAGKSFCKPGWQEALARSMPGDLVIRRRDQLIRL